MSRRVLLIHSGATLPDLAPRFGDFDRWFTGALAGFPVAWSVVKPFAGEALPDPSPFDAVLMTGSLASVADELPWMVEAARWIRQTVEEGTPFLGVCFGHQMLSYAFGARIVKNPKGLELGTVEVALTDEGRADPLFAGMGPTLRVHESHEDMAADVPSSVHILAGNAWTPVQAIAVGHKARGVQFHPEMTAEIVRSMAHAIGAKPQNVEDAPVGPHLLRMFLERFARNVG